MTDRITHQDRLKGILQTQPAPSSNMKRGSDGEGGEGACAAFGYLRGLRERADAIEFRLRNGNSVWFPYGWLGMWKFDPSEGLLLKFTGDVIYLVLIRGSNLDRPLADSSINLTNAGLQRHRVLWIKEMTNEDSCTMSGAEPFIDNIQIVEFESHAQQLAWTKQNASAFAPNC